MPKKKVTTNSTEEEGRRLLGKGNLTRHPQHKAALEVLNQQAPPVNLPKPSKAKPKSGGVGPDTTT